MKRSRLKRTKRVRCLLIFAALLLLAACVLCGASPVAAAAFTAEEEEAVAELRAKAEELLKALDTQELEAYLKTLPDFEKTQLKEVLARLVMGDFALDYSSLLSSVLALVWEEGKVMLPALAVIIAVTLLCGVLTSEKSGVLHDSMAGVIRFAAYVSVGAALLSVLISVLQAGFSAMQEMQRQMELVYPLLLTLMAASGGAVSAGIFRPAVAFLSGAVCEMFTSVVLPTSVAVIVLAFAGNLSDDVKTAKLGDFFKSVNKWLIGLALGILGIFLTVQGIAAAQYDGISLRTVKYVISGSVPVVGGFLSGSVDLVLAGSALIKNALGSFSVLLLAAVVLKPLLLLAATQLFLRIAAAATEPVGGKIPVLLSRLAGDLGYCTASLLSVAFLYFLTLLLLVCSSGVL